MAGVATIVREVLGDLLDRKIEGWETYRDRHPHYYRVKVAISRDEHARLERRRAFVEEVFNEHLPDLIEATPYTWEVGGGYGNYGWAAGTSYGFVVKVKREPLYGS